MARAAWQGYVTLGQLGIPVRLYTAVQSVRPQFVRLHEKDGSPVERVLQCSSDHREIRVSETIRAVEYEPGKYVPLTDQELARATSATAKTIDIRQFCDSDAIDTIFYEKPFYVVPGAGGERGYALLREVFARTNKIAIGQFVIYEREHIAALAVQGDLLVLSRLRFANELVPRSSIKTPPLPKSSPAEIEALTTAVEHLSGPLYIQDYHDEYGEYVQQLVERKSRGLSLPRRQRIAPHATPEDKIIPALQGTLGGELDTG